MKTLVSLLLFVLFLFPIISSQKDADLLIQTEQGPVKGTVHQINENIRQFLGIPFAKPPVGALRFRPAVYPADSWTEPLNATQIPPVCPQPGTTFGIPKSEDCLYLNVYTPRGRTQNPLPVIIWIHGGSFIHGSGILYDGSYLSNFEHASTVVVTINYRLGAYGFLAHPELLNQDKTTGNAALFDQRAAMVWVQKNIKNFNGDPNRVTIAGQSAGGASTLSHHIIAGTKPEWANLFNRTISQSGVIGPKGDLLLHPIDRAYLRTSAFLKSLGCPETGVVACLATKSQDDIAKAEQAVQKSFTYGPTIDGNLFTKPYEESLLKGEFATDVPIIVGSTKDEFSYEACAKYGNSTWLDIPILIAQVFGSESVNKLMKLYDVGPANYSTPISSINRMVADYNWHCPARRYVSHLSKIQYYSYLYSWEYQIVPYQSLCKGVDHSAEIPFLFPNTLAFLGPKGYQFASDEQTLSDMIIRNWAYFASSGDPNYVKSTRLAHHRSLKQCFFWKYYNDETQFDLKFSVTREARVRSNYYATVCDFWDTFSTAKQANLSVLDWNMK